MFWSARSRIASCGAPFVDLSQEFGKINVDALADEHRTIWAGSEEENLRRWTARACAAPARPAPSDAAGPKGTTALDRFSQDLTAKAKSGEMDPILGRDEEIRQIIDVLMRRRQNNPILTGEAGVGKTAVVEGFAQRVAIGRRAAAAARRATSARSISD